MTNEEVGILTGCFFALGIIYKIKLEKKHGGRMFTQKEIKEMEDKLAAAVEDLSEEAKSLFKNMQINNDMGLLTDMYGWPSNN